MPCAPGPKCKLAPEVGPRSPVVSRWSPVVVSRRGLPSWSPVARGASWPPKLAPGLPWSPVVSRRGLPSWSPVVVSRGPGCKLPPEVGPVVSRGLPWSPVVVSRRGLPSWSPVVVSRRGLPWSPVVSRGLPWEILFREICWAIFLEMSGKFVAGNFFGDLLSFA
jgi:hypothetical protein